ncbi:MAG: helix-turn-helix transcriptional regulator, partial [Planctomycetes bacterium]|nr:helix-turn-helix transcriptional regulator [Planctomycetota bacterium]
MVKKTFKLNLILTWYDRLKSVRKKTGLSQEVFAKEVTLSKQQVTRLETNNANPTPDFLKKLSELFDVNLNWFISGKGPEKLSHVIDENDLVYYPTESLENEL